MATALKEMSESAGTQPPPRKHRRVRLVLLVVVVLAAAGAVSVFVLGGGSDAEEVPEAPVEGAVVDVAQMTANLAGPQVHYVRLGFAAVLAEGLVAGDVDGQFPLLKDAALSELGLLSPAQLLTPEGVEELRARLSERARTIYPDGEVLRVVLTELVVQ